MQNIAIILLAVWLILVGLAPLINIQLPLMDVILNLLVIASGALMLIGGRRIKFSGRIAVIFLAVYLILSGLLPLLTINFPAAGLILGLLAIASGLLLLLKR